jgi:hypothetical protein
MTIKELTSPNWENIKQVPNPTGAEGTRWECWCPNCGEAAYLTTSEVRRGKKCLCTADRKKSLYSVDGKEFSLAYWVKEYPSINPRTVRYRAHRRNAGFLPYVNWEDSQILFGEEGYPKTEPVPIRDSKMEMDFYLTVMDTVGNAIKPEIRKIINTLAPVEPYSPKVAGGRFELYGTAVQEYLDMDTPVEEVIAMLESLEFTGLDEKRQQLSEFIPVDCKHSTKLTRLEAMAMLSLVV